MLARKDKFDIRRVSPNILAAKSIQKKIVEKATNVNDFLYILERTRRAHHINAGKTGIIINRIVDFSKEATSLLEKFDIHRKLFLVTRSTSRLAPECILALEEMRLLIEKMDIRLQRLPLHTSGRSSISIAIKQCKLDFQYHSNDIFKSTRKGTKEELKKYPELAFLTKPKKASPRQHMPTTPHVK